MGWGDCGDDSQGRPIGYVFEATCDHPTCERPINRGLAHVCGGMHGDDELSCERYFCFEHKRNLVEADGRSYTVCDQCYVLWQENNTENG